MKRRIAKIAGQENLQKAFEDLFHVMVNLRIRTKEWEYLFGVETKKVKKFWEDKADKLIDDLENGIYSPKENKTTFKSKRDVHRDNKVGEQGE